MLDPRNLAGSISGGQVKYDDDGGTDRGAVWLFSLSANGSATLLQKISDTSGGFTGVLDDAGWRVDPIAWGGTDCAR